MKVIVTGSEGFIGSNLVNELIKRGNHVIGLDKLREKKSNYFKKKNYFFFKKDVKKKNIKKYFNNADCIVHLAAGTNVINSIKNPRRSFEDNLTTNINILEIAKDLNINKIIFASTGGAIIGDNKGKKTNEKSEANPQSPYGAFKLSSEIINNAYSSCYKLKVINLRFSNVYGPYSIHKKNLIPNIFKSIVKKKFVKLNGDGKQSRDFIYVRDVIDAIIKAIKYKNYGTFNVCYGRSITVNNIIKKIENISKKKIKLSYKKSIPGEVKHSILNNFKIKKKLGFEIKHSLDLGLKKTWLWFKENYK